MECPILVNQKASKLLDPAMAFACHRTKTRLSSEVLDDVVPFSTTQ